jgi:hypothetical protein
MWTVLKDRTWEKVRIFQIPHLIVNILNLNNYLI